MIRRQVDDAFLLIAQHDHALLAERLACRVGGMRFAPPQPREATLRAVEMHDCGWPIHDERPTLNERGLPLHLFETPPSVGVQVWRASADRASAADPYAGLLVSLHVLALSALAMRIYGGRPDDPRSRQHQFLLNRFQHNEVERQEHLRGRLGMRIDLPLRQGLARPGEDRREDELIRNFRLLQAMDRLSLALCCSERPFDSIELPPHPGTEPSRIELAWSGPQHLMLRPWPFEAPRIEIAVPYRRVPARSYPDEASFRTAYQAAPRGSLPLLVTEAQDRD